MKTGALTQVQVCAEGAGQLPNYDDLHPSRTTNISEAPSDPIPSSLCLCPLLSGPVTSLPLLESSSISVTVLLCPSRRAARSSLKLRGSSLSLSISLASHLCSLRAPPWTPWGPRCVSLFPPHSVRPPVLPDHEVLAQAPQCLALPRAPAPPSRAPTRRSPAPGSPD